MILSLSPSFAHICLSCLILFLILLQLIHSGGFIFAQPILDVFQHSNIKPHLSSDFVVNAKLVAERKCGSRHERNLFTLQLMLL